MLFTILGAPFSLPAAGFRFVFDQLITMAENELYDEARIREDLLMLQVRLDEGEISEDEYVELEADIMARLREARAYREAQARAQQEADEDEEDGSGTTISTAW